MQTRWAVVQDFSDGFQAKRDQTQMSPGSLIVGSQNVSITDGDRIGVRPGSVIDGSDSSATTPITSMHTFLKRDSTNIQMRAYGTVVEYKHPTLGTWQNLLTSMTSGQKFGFADFNINTQNEERTYFCNAVDPYYRWTGAYTLLNGALSGGESTITVDSVLQDQVYYSGTASSVTTTTIDISPAAWASNLWNNFYVRITSGAQSGKISKISATTTTQITFTAISGLSGTPTFEIRRVAYADSSDMKLRIGTSDVTYTGFGSDSTFTGCSGTPAASDNAAVTQAAIPFAAAPRGNILLVEKTRMFVAGVKKSPSAWHYSTTGDAETFSGGTSGIVDFPEKGGPITGAGIQEGFIYTGKQNNVLTLSFTQDGTNLPVRDTLVEAPNVGPSNFQGVFKVDNQLYFTTLDGAVKSIGRVESIDTPQALQLSDSISEYVKDLSFTDAQGIFYKQKAYIACRTSGATANDVVLVYNFQKRAWEAPIIGWSVGAWNIYNNNLYFGSAVKPVTYQVDFDRYDDDGLPYASVARFSYNNFGSATNPKKASQLFMEGYLSENTTITIRVLYNYNGAQEERSTTLSGTESDYIVGSTNYNALGLSPLGLQPLAATIETVSGLPKFRVYLTTEQQPFYEISVEVSSEAAGDQWEILRFAWDAELQPNPVTNLKKRLA